VLRWSYSGSNLVRVYRSTDGTNFSPVSDALTVGTTSYTDTGLATGTKYWYKLSDDSGSTFSSVVTVWTHGCAAPATGGGEGFSLPRLHPGGGDPANEFNDMAQRIENVLQGRVLDPTECAACPEDGAIVIDCSDGCRSFVVIADQDINSISIQMCAGEGNIDFIVPPNQTRKICGFPAGFGFTGDECTEAPISGGATGRTMSVGFECLFDPNNVAAHLNSALCSAKASKTSSKAGYTKGGAGGAGGVGGSSAGGGAGCTCVPGAEGQLTIKSCNANNSLNCSSNKELKLIACGGKGPYNWSRTGTVNLKGSTGSPGSTASGTTITVTPPANNGSGVSGTAYRVEWINCTFCVAVDGVCDNCGPPISEEHGCNDQVIGCTTTSSCGSVTCSTVPTFGPTICNDFGNGPDDTTFCGNPVKSKHLDRSCDVRTAQMITDGCNPCGLAALGATVSVTDAAGVVTTIILKN
jgi:hypothetical protein